MADTEVQVTSLLSSDFGSGRWSGGRATCTDVWYEYRTADGKKGKFTVVETHVKWEDSDGQDHEVRYGVGGGDYVCIREEPDESSDEAEKGHGLSGRNGKQFRLNADSETGQLLLSLYNNGVPESRIGNDIRGIVGIEAELVERPHAGKGADTDKYPMLLASEVYNVGGKGKSKVSKKDVDADEPSPKKGAAAVSGNNKGPSGRAIKLVMAALKDGDGTTTSSDVIRSAAKALKGDDDRKDILDLLGDDDWIADQDNWTYKKRTGEITAA